MTKNLNVRFGSLLIIFSLTMSGCFFPGGAEETLTVEEQAQTIIAETLAPNGESSETVSAVLTPTVTDTPAPTITLTSTITLTATPEKPMVSVSVDTNCRSGPGKIYDWIGGLLVGEKAEVVGQSMDGNYWVIKNPDRAGDCWLWGNYATVVGPIANLPKFTPPPTPTPVFNWAGTWMINLVPTGGGLVETYTMTTSVNGKTFSGTMSGGGANVILSGTISDDYLSVSGTWQGNISGTFKFYAFGVNQFQGKRNTGVDDYGWCGGRNGAAPPSPCYVP